MPEISRFLGIVITMYAEMGERHNEPHFHARYAEYKATFSIQSGDLLAGNMPRAQLRLIQAWVELHRTELQECWQFLTTGRLPGKIAPLS